MAKEKIDRRILKSQAAIKSTFIHLLSEKSFDKIRVKDICEQADIGNRTFYLHYLDKFDLLDKLIDEHLLELKEICEKKKNLGVIEGTRIWFNYFQENQAFFSSLFKGNTTSSFKRQLLTFIIEEINWKVDLATIEKQGLTETVYFRFLGMAIIGVIELYLENPDEMDSDVLADQVSILVGHNLM